MSKVNIGINKDKNKWKITKLLKLNEKISK